MRQKKGTEISVLNSLGIIFNKGCHEIKFELLNLPKREDFGYCLLKLPLVYQFISEKFILMAESGNEVPVAFARLQSAR